MTKTEALRATLTAAGRPQLRQVIGRQKLYTMLAGLKTAGEIETVGRGDDRFYTLKKRKSI